MGNWVVLNKKELEFIMILFGKTSLQDIAFIDEDYQPDLEAASQMLNKGFFDEDSEGRELNPFVYYVMESVLEADCVIRTFQANGAKCYVYFKSGVMIVLSKQADKDEYVFYFVPYVPKAVGCLSCHYEFLTQQNQGNALGEVKEIIAENDIAGINDLKEVLKKCSVKNVPDEDFVMAVQGDVFGKPLFFGLLVNTEDGLLFAQSEGRAVVLSEVNGYGALKIIAEWLIEVHGSCISWGENNE